MNANGGVLMVSTRFRAGKLVMIDADGAFFSLDVTSEAPHLRGEIYPTYDLSATPTRN